MSSATKFDTDKFLGTDQWKYEDIEVIKESNTKPEFEKKIIEDHTKFTYIRSHGTGVEGL